jgi:hypothetical protein
MSLATAAPAPARRPRVAGFAAYRTLMDAYHTPGLTSVDLDKCVVLPCCACKNRDLHRRGCVALQMAQLLRPHAATLKELRLPGYIWSQASMFARRKALRRCFAGLPQADRLRAAHNISKRLRKARAVRLAPTSSRRAARRANFMRDVEFWGTTRPKYA